MIQLFKALLPQEKPKITDDLRIKLEAIYKRQTDKVCIIGLRGFYNPGNNQRAIYDDAIFIVSPGIIDSFNGNCDPGAYRERIANLIPGCWRYKLGIHGLSKPKFLQYQALVQAKTVTVKRDKQGLDTGWFGINIHKGGYASVSSLGCQTIHPRQWSEFIDKVKHSMHIYAQKEINYILEVS